MSAQECWFEENTQSLKNNNKKTPHQNKQASFSMQLCEWCLFQILLSWTASTETASWEKGQTSYLSGLLLPRVASQKVQLNQSSPVAFGLNTASHSAAQQALYLFSGNLIDGNLKRTKGNTSTCIFGSAKKHLNCLTCVPWSLKHNSSFLAKQPKHQPAFAHNSSTTTFLPLHPPRVYSLLTAWIFTGFLV